MLFYDNSLLAICFGNRENKLYPDEYLNLSKDRNILEKEPFAKLQKLLDIEYLTFLKQTHSTNGLVVTHDHMTMPSFTHEGDFLITDIPSIGLGIMTADCLPLIINDPVHNVIATVHAGWKGTINNIAITVIKKMQKLFKTNLDNVHLIFGPSAKKCCYQVSENFVSYIRNNTLVNDKKVLHRKNGKLFFDLPGFNQFLLEAAGIKKNAFCLDYNICTICDNQFFSYRRQGEQAGRQMTIAHLK